MKTNGISLNQRGYNPPGSSGQTDQNPTHSLGDFDSVEDDPFVSPESLRVQSSQFIPGTYPSPLNLDNWDADDPFMRLESFSGQPSQLNPAGYPSFLLDEYSHEYPSASFDSQMECDDDDGPISDHDCQEDSGDASMPNASLEDIHLSNETQVSSLNSPEVSSADSLDLFSGTADNDGFRTYWNEQFQKMGVDYLSPSELNILGSTAFNSIMNCFIGNAFSAGDGRVMVGTLFSGRDYAAFDYKGEDEVSSRLIDAWFRNNNAEGDGDPNSSAIFSNNFFLSSCMISLLEFGFKNNFFNEDNFSSYLMDQATQITARARRKPWTREKAEREYQAIQGRWRRQKKEDELERHSFLRVLSHFVTMSKLDLSTPILLGVYRENELSKDNPRLEGIVSFPLGFVLRIYNKTRYYPLMDYPNLNTNGDEYEAHFMSVSIQNDERSIFPYFSCKVSSYITSDYNRNSLGRQWMFSPVPFDQNPSNIIVSVQEQNNQLLDKEKFIEMVCSLAPQRPVLPSSDSVTKASVPPRINQAASQLVHKKFKTLSRKLETYYGWVIPDEFRAVLVRNRGKWGIDFSSADHPELPRDTFLKPFQEFLMSPSSSEDKKAALEAVRKMFRFFRFTASLPESGETEADAISPLVQYENAAEVDPSLVSKCIEELLRKATPVDELEEVGSPLSEFAANEVKQSFLTLKLAELRVVANHLVQTNEEFIPVPAKQIPCFLLTQDANRVRIQIMSAHFDNQECLTHFSEDSEQMASSLLTGVLGEELIIHENESKGKYATLTLPQLASLQAASYDPHTRSRLPPVLMLERLDPVAPVEESLLAPSDSIRDRDRRGRGVERGGQKRRIDSDVLRAPHKKRRMTEGESADSELRGNEQRKDLAFEHEYAELEELEEVTEVKQVPGSKNPTGILPLIHAQGNQLGSTSSSEKLTVHNFWKMLNRQSTSAIESKVRKEVIKETVLQELAPLDYPIFDAISKLPPPTSYHPWCRILKPYQVKAVAELLRFRSAGLSKLLSLEMGLGKTFIFGEYIAQSISKSATPQLHIVAVPLSLLEQTQRELTRFLLEASVTAWQMSGKRPQNTSSYIALANTVNELGDDLGNFTRFLRILTYFPHAKRELKSHQYAKLSSADHLEQTRAALSVHGNDIAQLCQHDARMQQNWDAAVKSFCREFSCPEFESFDALIDYIVRPDQSDDERFTGYRLAGTILDFSPERTNSLPNSENLSDEAIRNIRDLGFISGPNRSPVFIAKTSQEIKSAIGQSLQTSQILVTTHMDLFAQLTILKKLPIGSLVMDEASKIHNPGSTIFQRVQDAVTELKLHKTPQQENAVLLVTGTPFENSIEELWTLFQLNNGQAAFSNQTLASLNRVLLKESLKQLTNPEKVSDRGDQEPLESLLIKSFAHFMQLSKLSEHLVYRLKRGDAEVIDNWNGRFPTVNYRKIVYRFSEEALEELQTDLPEKKRRGIFGDSKRVERFLIHPSLKNNTLVDQQKEKFTFLDILRKKSEASREDKIAWTGQSAYLQAVLTDRAFQTALANKEKIVIVVNTHAQSKTYKKAIKLLFAESKVNVFEYHGDQSREQRDEVLKKFTDPSACTPQVLLLMLKVGGVGLNLPQAKWLFLATISWNPATEDQAIARIIRANQTGSKEISRLVFPDLYESNHPRMIQKVKRKWEAFLWQGGRSLKDSLDLWVDVLQAETFRVYLNKHRSKEVAKEKNLTVESFLNDWKQSLSEKDLCTALEKATPIVKSSERPSSSSSSVRQDSSQLLVKIRVKKSSLTSLPLPQPFSENQGASSSSSVRQDSSQISLSATPAQKKILTPQPLPLSLSKSQGTSFDDPKQTLSEDDLSTQLENAMKPVKSSERDLSVSSSVQQDSSQAIVRFRLRKNLLTPLASMSFSSKSQGAFSSSSALEAASWLPAAVRSSSHLPHPFSESQGASSSSSVRQDSSQISLSATPAQKKTLTPQPLPLSLSKSQGTSFDDPKQTFSEDDLSTQLENAMKPVKSSERDLSVSSSVQPDSSQAIARFRLRKNPLTPLSSMSSSSKSQGASSSSSARNDASWLPAAVRSSSHSEQTQPVFLPKLHNSSSVSANGSDHSDSISMRDYLVIPLPYTREDALYIANYIGQNKDTSEQIQRIAQLIKENERAGIRQQLRNGISTEGTPASEIIKILEGFKEGAGKISEELLGNAQIYQLDPRDNQLAFLVENFNPQMEPQVKLRLASDGRRYDILIKKR